MSNEYLGKTEQHVSRIDFQSYELRKIPMGAVTSNEKHLT